MVFSSWLLKAMSSSCTERGGASYASCSAECRRMHIGIVLGVTVRSPCLSVILVLEFSDRGISQIGSQPNVSIRKSS